MEFPGHWTLKEETIKCDCEGTEVNQPFLPQPCMQEIPRRSCGKALPAGSWHLNPERGLTILRPVMVPRLNLSTVPYLKDQSVDYVTTQYQLKRLFSTDWDGMMTMQDEPEGWARKYLCLFQDTSILTLTWRTDGKQGNISVRTDM
jgi:hypothetical protein